MARGQGSSSDASEMTALQLLRERARKGVCSNKLPVLELTPGNYDQWLHALKLRFTLCELSGLIPGSIVPQHAQDAELQQFGLALLLPTLSENDRQHVWTARTVADAIQAIHTARHGTRRIHQVNLLVNLFNVQMGPSECIADFIRRVETNLRELSDAGIRLDPLVGPIKVITAASKLEKYRQSANIVLGSDQPLTMTMVHQSMRAVEITDEEAAPTGAALAVAASVATTSATDTASDTASALAAIGKQLQRFESKLTNSISSRTQGQGQGQGQPQQQQQQQHQNPPERARTDRVGRKEPYQRNHNGDNNKPCHNCGRSNHLFTACYRPCSVCGGPGPANGGHSSHQCPRRAQGQAGAAVGLIPELTGSAFMGGGEFDIPMPPLDVVTPPFDPNWSHPVGHYMGPRLINGPPGSRPGGMANGVSPFKCRSQWFLDNGASHHMTPCKEYLHDFVPDVVHRGSVSGVGGALSRAGVGTLMFTATVNGKEVCHKLPGVWYVPAMSVSLLSAQQLHRDGYWTTQGGPHDPTYYVINQAGECVLECPHTGFEGTLNIPSFKPILSWSSTTKYDLERFPYHHCVNPALKTVRTPVRFSTPTTSRMEVQVECGMGASGCAQRMRGDGTIRDPLTPSCAQPVVTSGTIRDPMTPVCEWQVITPGTRRDPNPLGCTQRVRTIGQGVCSFSLANHASDPETPELWHQRLGHMNYQSLYRLVHQGCLQGINVPVAQLKQLHNDKCEVCVMAKHRRAAAPPREDRAEGIMHTLHSDVEVYPEKGLDGSVYAVTLMDECSSNAGIVTLSHKSGVEESMKTMILRWESVTGKKAKYLITDRGGEYFGTSFTQWCNSKGIIHNKSPPKTPHLNGKAERLNQTLGDQVRAMLLNYNLAKQLWPYALRYAVLLYNVGWNKRLNVTRYQAFHGKVPNVRDYRTFGCKVFARLAESSRDKLDPKSDLGIYLGPANDGPGCQVLRFRPELKHKRYSVQVFRDVVTFEHLHDVCHNLPSSYRWGGEIPLPVSGGPLTRSRAHEAAPPSLGDPDLQPLTTTELQQRLSLVVNPSMSVPESVQDAPDSGENAHDSDTPAVVRVSDNPQGVPTHNVQRLLPAYYSAAALFDSHLNTGKAMAYNATSVAKRKQISSCRPVPSEHLCVPLLHVGPIVPITQAKAYYQQHPLPVTPAQAMSCPFAKQWLGAMHSELEALHANNTWTLVPHHPAMTVIPCRWVFVIKYDAQGAVSKFKARLVAGGHRQQEGIDFTETYAPVSRYATHRTFLSEAAWHGWQVHQLDITTAFLNGVIDTDVYMKQPPGFADGNNMVCHLQKCLYGLKQAPRVWYHTLKHALLELGFKCVPADTSFWVRHGEAMVYLTCVVDDMMVASPNPALTQHIVKHILMVFKGVNGGIAHHYSGFKLTWVPSLRAVWLTQTSYIEDMVAKFKPLCDSWQSRPYFPWPEGLRVTPTGTSLDPESPLLDVVMYHFRSGLGSTCWVAFTSRPDAAFYCSQLSRVANMPTVAHWDLLMRLMQYFDSTKHEGIKLGGRPQEVETFVDSSHGTGTSDGWPVRGHVVCVHGGPVSWASKTIRLTCTSSTESEYRAMSECVKEVLWMSQILSHFNVICRPLLIRGDNQAAINAVTSHAVTAHTKHIELHIQFMREKVEQGDIAFKHIKGSENPADIFTKSLGSVSFQKCKAAMGVCEPP